MYISKYAKTPSQHLLKTILDHNFAAIFLHYRIDIVGIDVVTTIAKSPVS